MLQSCEDARMSIGTAATTLSRHSPALVGGFIAMLLVSPARAQNDCTTNYCIRSQSLSVQVPAGWPAVTVAPCCKTDWGALPGGIDWSKGSPVMLCTGNAEYATTYPN